MAQNLIEIPQSNPFSAPHTRTIGLKRTAPCEVGCRRHPTQGRTKSLWERRLEMASEEITEPLVENGGGNELNLGNGIFT